MLKVDLEGTKKVFTSMNLKLFRIAKSEGNATGEYFSEFLLRDKTGDIVINHALHKNIQRFTTACFSKNLFANIEVSMGMGKTEQMISRIVFEIINSENYNIRIALICENDEQAKQRIKSVKQYLKQIQPLFDFAIEQETSHGLLLKRPSASKDWTLRGYGLNANYTGIRADLIILDDVLETIDNTLIQDLQEKIWQTFNEKILTRLDEGGRVLNIGTPYTRNGNVKKIEMDTRFKTLKIFLNDDYETFTQEKIFNGKIIDVEKLPKWDYYSPEKFRKIFENNPRFFKLAYQLNPEQAEVFKSFNIDNNVLRMKKIRDYIINVRAKQNWININSIDISGINRAGTVITYTVIDKETKKIIVYETEYLKINFTDLRDHIIRRNGKNTKWIIETNAFQVELKNIIQEKCPEVEIISHITSRNKNDIASGVLSMSSAFEKKKIIFNIDDEGTARQTRELNAYGMKAGTFDGVMSLWFIYYHLADLTKDEVKIAEVRQQQRWKYKQARKKSYAYLSY